MENEKLIQMLNRDLADEHAAILRYMTHSYLEGEDTSIGASLLSRAREEMWHMHWLGMIIGKLGGEPDMTPAPYPHDPTNRATIFQSYIDYEKKLVPHYEEEADMVDDPHIRRVLLRESWESDYHALKFKKILDKLSSEEASGLPGEANELSEALVERIQQSVTSKYRQMLQTIRDAWVFQSKGEPAWQRMDFSMTKMKQLAHSAEEIAENGLTPRLTTGRIIPVGSLSEAMTNGLEDVRKTIDIHERLAADSEAKEHGGLMTNLDLTLRQEKYEAEELRDRLSKSGA
ncbi:MAG: ferritin-like domain-containing protein [Desulfosalsimonadaceae bacterium]